MQTTLTMMELGWDEEYLLRWGEPLLLLLYVLERVLGLLGPVSFPVLFGRSAPRRRDNKRRDRCSYLLGVVRGAMLLAGFEISGGGRASELV